MTADTIRHDSTYRRGVILGFTMAEIVVLVVFCLMALMAVLIQEITKRDQQIAAMKAEQARLGALDDGLARQLYGFLQQVYPGALYFDDFVTEVTDDVTKAKLYDEMIVRLGTLPPDKLPDTVKLGAELGNAFPNLTAQEIIDRLKSSQNDAPPLIELRDTANKFFALGSAEVTAEFRTHLETDIAQKIVDYLQQYNVNVVEIVGHTDELAFRGRGTTLDDLALKVIRGEADPSVLRAADNAGLGLARAIAVMRVLKTDPRLKDVTMLPLTSAQLVQPVDVLADGSMIGDVAERRRIEIRLRRKPEKVDGR